MKGNNTFKIEMQTKKEATKFLSNTNTAIGGIKLLQQHKEREIDPSINQCWGCGVSQSAVAPRTEHVFSEWFACAEIRLRPLCNRRLQGPQIGVAPDWCCSREHSQYGAVPKQCNLSTAPRFSGCPVLEVSY